MDRVISAFNRGYPVIFKIVFKQFGYSRALLLFL
jgi:hypothetical protein